MTIRDLFNKLIRFFKPEPPPAPFDVKPISTVIIVKVGDKAVGAIQSLSITEKRCENDSLSVTAKASRVRFDKARVAEAFSRGFVHVSSQRYPLQIEIIDGDKITTTLRNAWITALDYTYTTGDWIITDQMELEAETIFSFKTA
jgi:hypothetical protein